MTRVSVVIPTYNRLERLKRVLTGLEKQTFLLDDFEIVLISDGSSDGTDEFLRTVHTPLRLQLISQPSNQGPAAARNLGVARCVGNVVLFMDDDVVPTSTLIAEHVRIHDTYGDHVVVIGPMVSPPDFKMSPWAQWEQIVLAKQYHAMHLGQWEATARQLYTGNASVRRAHLIETGGFDPTLTRSEDVELGYRLAARGLRFVFAPKAMAFHYVERSYASWVRTPYLYGCHDVILTYTKGQHWLLPKVFEEFHTRHPLMKAFVRLCLGRPRLSKINMSGLKYIAEVGHRLKWMTLSRTACSAIFNLRYYQGIADELGGRNRFFTALTQEPQPPMMHRADGKKR